MSSVLVHPTTARSPRRRQVLYVLAGVVATAAILAGLLASVQRPDFVSQVVVENRTGVAVDVDVAGGPHEGVTLLGNVGAHETNTYGDVVDQGDRWVVRVRAPSRQTVTLTFTRDEMTRAHWRVVIPSSVALKPTG
jgi:hypothetical protein